MKKTFTTLIFFLLLACIEDGTELNRYILSDNEKEFIPYSENENITLTYSNGFDFKLNVVSNDLMFKQTEIEHKGDDYVTYQENEAILESNIPELYISVLITPKEFYPYLRITINNYEFGINFTETPDFKTLIINGETFTDVYLAEKTIFDSNIISPKSLYYNKSVGIIQIKMTNNEEYTIKK